MFQINDVHDRREMAQYYNVPVPVVSPQPVYMFTNEHHIPTVAADKVFVGVFGVQWWLYLEWGQVWI